MMQKGTSQQEFKQTEIGRIPKEWEVVSLRDERLTEIIMGQSPPSVTYNKNGRGIPFLQGKAEFGETYPSPVIFCSEPIKIAEPNDILISVRAPVGDINIAPLKCCIGRGLASIRSKNHKLHPFYLFYFLKSQKRNLENLSSGSTFKAIKKEDIENFLLPLPPLPEQKKIAEILSTVDKAIEKVGEALEKTERLKKGLMQKLLTRGIGHKEFKDTEIGRIPREWEVTRLREICNQRNEVTQPTRKGEFKFIGLEHIDSGKTKPRSFELDLNIKSSKFRFYKNDILYGKLRPYLDKAVIVDFDGICSTDLIVLNPNTKANLDFLIYILHFDKFLNHAISTTSGTNHPRTSWNAISKFKLSLPPLPEQKKIAEILSTVDKRLELLRKKKEKLERVKKGLMDDLLSGRRRVKI